MMINPYDDREADARDYAEEIKWDECLTSDECCDNCESPNIKIYEKLWNSGSREIPAEYIHKIVCLDCGNEEIQ